MTSGRGGRSGESPRSVVGPFPLANDCAERRLRTSVGGALGGARSAALVGLAFALALELTMAGGVAGQERPLVGDRPDFTESTETVEPGHLQLETGATFSRTSAGDTEELMVGEVLLRVGLSASWELRIGAGSLVDVSSDFADVDGLEDASLGFKVKLLAARGRAPDLALLLGTSLPTGSSELTDDVAVPEVKVAAGWSLAERLGLGANVGWARAVDGGERFDQLSWSVAAGLDLGGDWAAFGELYGFSEEDLDGDPTLYFDAGITRLIHSDLQLDARVGAGLIDGGGEIADWFAGVGAVVRW